MQLAAIVAAGFTPGEADQLRRAMGAWRRKGGWPLPGKLLAGMAERGYRPNSPNGSTGRSRVSATTVSRIARRLVRAARLCLGLAQAPPSGGIPLRLAQQPADGFLLAFATGAGCAPPRRARAAGGCAGERWEATIATAVRPRPAGDCWPLAQGAEAVVAHRPAYGFASTAELARTGLAQRDLDLLAQAGALKAIAGHRRRRPGLPPCRRAA